MKIGQPSDPPVSASSPLPATQPKSASSASTNANTAASKSTQSAGVAVTVSTLARTLEAANRGEAAEVDTEKVNAVRAAIEQGSYVVNPEAIADKLLANAQELLDRTRN
ncbi:flagellar biosynthesis anti-sigma factor FlgM [Rhodoferax sp.]|uniref:flagellar biosynthesis anti-sigma factor FlgM n=1 Tax=Rhodoferax sp. TaxID=50421 RepID=UPI00276DF37E|nr:flagellar biosynthesis anti-sigma factor FlgM [Rhodoferax sp.]